jgi:UDP-N-acetylglucosamine--N-acetylmuramyl-(pentapeptide) pyrophosphoryl-undecaprenol N-acetylglucosamine transferase
MPSIEVDTDSRCQDFVDWQRQRLHAFRPVSNLRRHIHSARRLVLVGGGTAGHVYPALAIAEAYRKEVPSLEVLFFGTGGGFEAKLVPPYGYPLSVVHSTPIVGQSLLGKLRTVGGLGGAVMCARRMLIEAKPDLIIGFGGYASVPTMVAARSLGMFTAIHECNAIAGLANKLLGRFVDRVYLGFETASVQFNAGRTLVTGNPVRPDVQMLATQQRDPPAGQPFRILVTGGSQGSSFLNRQVPSLLSRLARLGLKLKMLHQSGPDDCESVRRDYRRGGLQASVVPFIDEMAEAYQWADIAISCAGAATLAELAILGMPVLLVPLLKAAKNHQFSNAAAFAQVTGGCWQSEDRWSPDDLLRTIARLLCDPAAWREAAEGVRRFAKPDASRMLVADCEATIQVRKALIKRRQRA